MPRNVCLLTDLLSEPFDEGMKVFALRLARHLQKRPSFHVLTNAARPPRDLPLETIPFGRSLLSVPLIRRLRECNPSALVYLPEASLTAASFLRVAVLRTVLRRVPLALISLQPRPIPPWAGRLARWLQPATIFEQTAETLPAWARLGIPAQRILAGVDPEQFLPADPAWREKQRAHYGLDPGAFLVGHVGHLQPSRNLAALFPLLNEAHVQALVVASTTIGGDARLAQDLRRRGIIVWEHFGGSIADVYRMLDGYVFPVTDPRGAIGLPLSILEALACGVPVISSSFGDLPQLFPPGSGVLFMDQASDLPLRVADLRGHPGLRSAARRSAERFTWDRAFAPLDAFLDEEIR